MSDAPRDVVDSLTTGCRILADQDIVDAYGHLSARVPDDDRLFVINRGMSPAMVTPEDFIVLDLDGNVVRGSGRPNVEWPIHARIYRARPDVRAILHSHSRLSRIFSLSAQPLRGVLGGSAGEWRDGVPVYRSAGLITSTERGDALARVLGDRSAALLRGHGDVVVSDSVRETVIKAITFNQNADVLHEALAHGDVQHWTADEIAVWEARRSDNVSRDAAAALANRAWDYYAARIDGRLARLLGRA